MFYLLLCYKNYKIKDQMLVLIPFSLFFILLFIVLVYYIANFNNSQKKIWQQTVFLYNKIHNYIIIWLYKYVISSMPDNKKEELVLHIADLHGRVIIEKDLKKRLKEESSIRDDIKDLYENAKADKTINDINVLYERVKIYEDRYNAVQYSHKRSWILMIITILWLLYSMILYMHYLNI